MDNKGPAFEFVTISDNLKRMRVDDGFVYIVRTVPDTGSPYWSTPFALPDRPSLKDVWIAVDQARDGVVKCNARIDSLTPAVKVTNVRDVETNGPGSSYAMNASRIGIQGRVHDFDFTEDMIADGDYLHVDQDTGRATRRPRLRPRRGVARRLFDGFRAFCLELY